MRWPSTRPRQRLRFPSRLGPAHPSWNQGREGCDVVRKRDRRWSTIDQSQAVLNCRPDDNVGPASFEACLPKGQVALLHVVMVGLVVRVHVRTEEQEEIRRSF